MINQKLIFKSLGYLLIILLSACHDGTAYHSYMPIDDHKWNRTDTLVFALDSAIYEGCKYELSIGIRHLDSYPYRDIWLTLNNDTLHFYLANEEGYWKGEGIGDLRHITYTIDTESQYNVVPKLRITHIMKHNPLPGIHDIGILLRQKH